jgi:hypothetical protein
VICEIEILTPSPLESSGVALEPKARQKLHVAMVLAGVALKKLRLKKLSRDSHQRRYARWGHIDRLKARDFAKSPHGREYYRKYEKERRKRPYYHFLNWLRGDINRSLRRQSATKGGRTESLIGCSFDELRRHLESQFINGFSWSNRSAWDVDHFIPVSAFLLSDPEEQRWAFNWQNMRPMVRLANQQKSDTLPNPLPCWLPAHLAARIIERASE